MKNINNILFYVILLSLFTFILSACDSPPKQKIKQNNNVVTKKIIKQDQNQGVAQAKPPEESKPPAVTQAKPSEESKPPEANKPSADMAKKETMPDKNNLKKTMEEDKSEDNFYVSEGKIDPFLSPIAKQNAAEKKKISNRKLTPLEKLDLSQVKLVAIINMRSGKKNVAMVQESNGKGYMVKVGTYIGTNKGRIIEIKNDEIIIKESIKNFKGVYEDRLKPMKLQKKDNG